MKRVIPRIVAVCGVALVATLPAPSSSATGEAERATAGLRPDPPPAVEPKAGERRVTSPVMPGDIAPDFELPDLDGVTHRLSDYLNKGNHVVLLWYNPTCKYMVKHFDTFGSMQRVYGKFADKGFVWLAINSGSETSGTADIELNREVKSKRGIEYPILMDTAGTVGLRYRTFMTPDFVVMDETGSVVYRGAFDRELSLEIETETPFIEHALTSIVNKQACEPDFVRPLGCDVKY